MDVNNDMMGYSLCLDDSASLGLANSNVNASTTTPIKSNVHGGLAGLLSAQKLESTSAIAAAMANSKTLSSFYVTSGDDDNDDDENESGNDDVDDGMNSLFFTSPDVFPMPVSFQRRKSRSLECVDGILSFGSAKTATSNNNNNNNNNKAAAASSSSKTGPNADQTTASGAQSGDLDMVKHRLNSFWNNVKYGWSRYLKLPANRLDVDASSAAAEPICILGKRFYSSDDYDTAAGPAAAAVIESFIDSLPTTTTTATTTTTQTTVANSDHADYYADAEYNNTRKRTLVPSYSIFNQQQQQQLVINVNDDFNSLSFSHLSVSPLSMPSHFASPSGGGAQQLQPPQQQQNHHQQQQQKRHSTAACQRLLNASMKTPLEQTVYSRLWFTYRKDFEPLNGQPKHTSDCGWVSLIAF